MSPLVRLFEPRPSTPLQVYFFFRRPLLRALPVRLGTVQ